MFVCVFLVNAFYGDNAIVLMCNLFHIAVTHTITVHTAVTFTPLTLPILDLKLMRSSNLSSNLPKKKKKKKNKLIKFCIGTAQEQKSPAMFLEGQCRLAIKGKS